MYQVLKGFLLVFDARTVESVGAKRFGLISYKIRKNYGTKEQAIHEVAKIAKSSQYKYETRS